MQSSCKSLERPASVAKSSTGHGGPSNASKTKRSGEKGFSPEETARSQWRVPAELKAQLWWNVFIYSAAHRINVCVPLLPTMLQLYKVMAITGDDEAWLQLLPVQLDRSPAQLGQSKHLPHRLLCWHDMSVWRQLQGCVACSGFTSSVSVDVYTVYFCMCLHWDEPNPQASELQLYLRLLSLATHKSAAQRCI